MSSLIQRGKKNVFYYQYYIDGKKFLKSLKTSNKTVAKQLKAKLDYELGEGKLSNKKRKISIHDAFYEFLKYKSSILTESTLKRYQQHINNLNSFFKSKEILYINDITYQEVQEYVDYRRSIKIKDQTIQKEIEKLKSIFKYFFEREKISKIPVKVYPELRPTPNIETTGAYNSIDIKQMKEYIKKNMPIFYDYFMFFIYTGVRQNELIGLKVKDINFEDNIIKIFSQKTARSGIVTRYIPLMPQLKQILEKKVFGKTINDSVFDEHNSKSKNWMCRCIKKTCKVLNIQYNRLHGLRHSYATIMMKNGYNRFEIMNFMGHTNIEQTMDYSHFTENDVKVLKNYIDY